MSALEPYSVRLIVPENSRRINKMVLCCIYQEDLCTTTLLGKPLLKQVLASIGHTKEPVFIIHDEKSDIGESIHEIDENIHCLPVESTTLSEKILEAVELAESLHLFKDSSITFFPLEYIFNVPILAELSSEPAIVCHTGCVGVPVSVESGKITKGDIYRGSIVHFADTTHLKSVCSNEFDSWNQMIEYMMDEKEVKAIVRQTNEVFSVASTEERTMYENYIHCFVFALDGVVANFSSFWYSIWTNTLAKFHIHLTTSIYSNGILGKSDDEIASIFGLPSNVLTSTKQSTMKQEIQKRSYFLTPGFDTMYTTVKKGGHIIKIYSEWPEELTSAVIESLGLPNDILTSQPTGLSNTVYFESRPHEINVAKQNAAKWIVGCPSYYSSAQLIKMGADVILQNFESPETIVETLLSPNSNSYEEYEQVFDIHESIQKLYPQTSFQIESVSSSESHIIPVRLSEVMHCVVKMEEYTKIASVLGVREELFYDKIARYVSVRVPKYYGAVKDKTWKTRGLLMEDVRYGNEFKTLDTESIDTVLRVVSELARLHAQFWDNTAELPLSFMDISGVILDSMWTQFETKWKDVLGTQAMERLHSCKERFTQSAQHLKNNHQTFLHGCVQSSNLYFNPDKTPGFLDWKYASIGKGVQDLVFLMVESFSVKTMDNYYSLIKQYYYTKLLEYGVVYSWSEYEADFAAAVEYYPLFVAIWYGTQDSEDPDQNFPFFYLQRYVGFLAR